MMKRSILIVLVAMFVLALGQSAQAIPSLQLDIAGGYYGPDETIYSSDTTFDLYAYLIVNKENKLSDNYYISAALVPKTGYFGAGDYGSFVFNGTTIAVTDDMFFGLPPVESALTVQQGDAGDLPPHGIFPTYFSEFMFTFNSANKSGSYNTQDNTGSGPIAGTGMYYAAFSIDTSLLNSDYDIHFDFYNEKIKSGGDIDINNFAPFSHDAQSNGHQVPEPSTILLMGMGLVGLGIFGRKKV